MRGGLLLSGRGSSGNLDRQDTASMVDSLSRSTLQSKDGRAFLADAFSNELAYRDVSFDVAIDISTHVLIFSKLR